MATYFLDTSALVKRHVSEPGHAWIQALCDPRAGAVLVISELALVEVIATFSRMARQTPRRISLRRRDRLIADFDLFVSGQYAIVEINRAILNRAVAMCRKHPLRAYDAVQLASALTRRDDDLSAGLPATTFVCADTTLLGAAASEGLAVENPNTHP